MDLISLSVITEKSAVIPYGAFHPNELWVEPWGPEGMNQKKDAVLPLEPSHSLGRQTGNRLRQGRDEEGSG